MKLSGIANMETIKIRTIKYGKYRVDYYSDEVYTGKSMYVVGYDNLKNIVDEYGEECVRV